MGEGEGEGADETSALRCGGAMQCGVTQCSAVRCSAVCAVWHLLLRRRVDRPPLHREEEACLGVPQPGRTRLPPQWQKTVDIPWKSGGTRWQGIVLDR